MSFRQRVVGVVLAAVVAAGVGAVVVHNFQRPAGPTLKSLVDGRTPPGFAVGPSAANGPLDRTAAARATPLQATDMEPFLRRRHFQDGYARVWTAKQAFFVSTALRFRTPADAQSFLSFMRVQFASLVGATIEDFGRSIPRAEQYTFYVRKPSGIYQICSGVVFNVQRVVHLVSSCDDNPPDVQLVGRRAVEQFDRSRRALHAGSSSIGPKAGAAMSSSSTTLQ